MADKAIRPAIVENFERGLLAAGAPLLTKWAHYLDADTAPKLKSVTDRFTMAKMLESTEATLAVEATQTTSVFGTNYVKTMLGLTRQIFPRMFGTSLVAVQPMDRAQGVIFNLALTRDDGSSLGLRPQDNATSRDSVALLASRTYADSPGEGQPITKGMALQITSTPISIGAAKKLKVSATYELSADLAATHGLNASDLLQGAATDEVASEIDAELVQAVRAAAIANKTITIGGKAPTGYSQREWNQEFPRVIIRADRVIQRGTLQRANVIVCGFDVYEKLVNLNGFQFAPNADWDTGSVALAPAGYLQSSNLYNVFVSRFILDNEMIVARRGEGFLSGGVVWSPLTALFISERFFNVTTQSTEQSFMSRYGINTISNLGYVRVIVDESSALGIV